MIHSTAGVRSDLFQRPLNETLLTDFFGGVSEVELSPETEGAANEVGDDVEAIEKSPPPTAFGVDSTLPNTSSTTSRKRRRRVIADAAAADSGRDASSTSSLATLAGAVTLGGAMLALQVVGYRLAASSRCRPWRQGLRPKVA